MLGAGRYQQVARSSRGKSWMKNAAKRLLPRSSLKAASPANQRMQAQWSVESVCSQAVVSCPGLHTPYSLRYPLEKMIVLNTAICPESLLAANSSEVSVSNP